MKYILTLVILVLLCSCTYKEEQLPASVKEVVRIPHVPSLYKFTFEGHDYLYGYHAGIIHSASCKSPEHYDTK